MDSKYGIGPNWWGQDYQVNGCGACSEIVTDPGTPDAPSVLQFDYPAGYSKGGNPPATYWNVFSDLYGETNELWVEHRVKYSPNYEWHPVADKVGYVCNGSSNYYVIWAMNQGRPEIRMQSDMDSITRAQNLGVATLVGGQWYKVTLHLVMNSPGQYDGVGEILIDGVKVLSHSNFGFANNGHSFSEVDITPVYGGVASGSKSQTDYQRYDLFHISDQPIGGGVSPPPDTTPPSVPAGLSATAVSSTQINLSWSASTDDVGVAGYKILRGGAQIANSVSTSYSDTGLTPSTTYAYTVSAFDAAGNESAHSAPVSAMTMATTPRTDLGGTHDAQRPEGGVADGRAGGDMRRRDLGTRTEIGTDPGGDRASPGRLTNDSCTCGLRSGPGPRGDTVLWVFVLSAAALGLARRARARS
jgi:hypothetical protein